MLRKRIWCLSILAPLAALIVSVVNAQSVMNPNVEGKVTVTGKVAAQTCLINVNASGSNNGLVQLPTVSSKAFRVAGQGAGTTHFYITLTQCKPGIRVTAQFEVNEHYRNAYHGYWLNTHSAAAGAARAIAIRVLNKDLTPIQIGRTPASTYFTSISVDGGAQLDFYAQYLYIGGVPVQEGFVTAHLPFTLIYQ